MKINVGDIVVFNKLRDAKRFKVNMKKGVILTVQEGNNRPQVIEVEHVVGIVYDGQIKYIQ